MTARREPLGTDAPVWVKSTRLCRERLLLQQCPTPDPEIHTGNTSQLGLCAVGEDGCGGHVCVPTAFLLAWSWQHGKRLRPAQNIPTAAS